MAANRGSTSQVTIIKEATAGVTPATPVMLEMPVLGFTPTHTNGTMTADIIRAHPFTDALLQGRLTHEFGLDFAVAGAVHDALFETMLGGVITTKALKFQDALLSLTLEEKVKAGVFNQFVYGCFSSLAISCAASDTAPVKVAMKGMAKAATLDAAATLATSVTPAATTTPFIFVGATATMNTVATPIASGSLQFDRQIDPLMLLGSRLPREFVPGAAKVSGSMTIPYDDAGAGLGATTSGFVTGFTDVAQVWKFADEAVSVYRQVTIPQTKFLSLGRALSDRGMRMQEVNWEAEYDSASATVATLATN